MNTYETEYDARPSFEDWITVEAAKAEAVDLVRSAHLRDQADRFDRLVEAEWDAQFEAAFG